MTGEGLCSALGGLGLESDELDSDGLGEFFPLVETMHRRRTHKTIRMMTATATTAMIVFVLESTAFHLEPRSLMTQKLDSVLKAEPFLICKILLFKRSSRSN